MSHLFTARNPMSEARRNAVNGPLQGMDDSPDWTHSLVRLASIGVIVFAIGLAVLTGVRL